MNVPLQAFVLKCPECGAPQPGPESICRFCKVLLMWAPARSLSRDDVRALGDEGVEDEPGTKLLTFGPTSVRAGEIKTFGMQASVFCRPTHLWIDSRTASSFYVKSLRVGPIELLALSSESMMSGSLFARGRGWPLADAESMPPGLMARLVVVQSTNVRDLVIAGALRVRTLPRDADLARELSPHGRGFGPQIVGGGGPQIVGGYGPQRVDFRDRRDGPLHVDPSRGRRR